MLFKTFPTLFRYPTKLKEIRCFIRPLSLSSELSQQQSQQADNAENEGSGWFKNLLRVRTLPTSSESHSSQLSSKETVNELQVHCVKPDCMEEYLKQYNEFQKMMHENDWGAKLVGSFTVEVGDQDEAIHIWEYDGGYPALNKATVNYRTNKDLIEFRVQRNKMLRSRRNQILLRFSFWPTEMPDPNINHIYELRSYVLKPGTMIEWGNNWARGIQNRGTNREAVAGFFSSIGDLYAAHHLWGGLTSTNDYFIFNNQSWARGIQHRSGAVAGFFTHLGEQYTVHHLWAYEDLQQRKETREAAWQRPGWDECVAYTVPLIRHMQSRILIPTPFSPLQ